MKAIIFTSPSPFLNISNATEIPSISSINGFSQTVDVMMVLSAAIAFVGIIGNFVVIIVFLNAKKLRRKIPNIFIIHQVSAKFHSVCARSLKMLILVFFPKLHKVGNVGRSSIFLLQSKFYFLVLILTNQFF